MRKLTINMLAYGVGDIIVKLATFVTLPIFTRVLTVTEFGTWNLILTTSGVVLSVLGLGSNLVYLRFFFTTEESTERQKITSTWFGFLALWSTGIILLMLPLYGVFAHWLIGDSSQTLLVALAFFNLPLSLMNTLCAQVLINQFRMRSAVTLNIIMTLLTVPLNVVGAIQFGILGIFVSSLLGSAIILVIRLWTVRELLRLRFSFALLKQMVSYGSAIIPASLAFWVFMSSDRVLLSNLVGLEQVGLYALANQIANMLNLVMNTLQQVWTPQATEIYEKTPEAVPSVYGQVLTYTLLVFGVLCVLMTVAGREIIRLLSSPQYYGASVAVGPLALGFLFYASAQVTYLGITLLRKKYPLATIPWIAALVNIGANILLIPRFGFVAAAWSTALAYAVLTLSYALASRRYFPIAYELQRIAVVVGLTIMFVVAEPLLPQADFLPSLLLRSTYLLGYGLLLIILGAINQRDLKVVLTAIQQIRLRFFTYRSVR